MLSTDLEIKKEKNLYQLTYKDIKIRCLYSNNYVENENKELIEFIKDDLFRCGELNINKEGRLDFKRNICAYLLFCSYDLLIKEENYNGINFKDFIKRYFIFDLVLVNLSSKCYEALEKVRNAIGKNIKGDYFDQLQDCGWGRYWNGMCKSFEVEEVEKKFHEDGVNNDIIRWEKNKIISRKTCNKENYDYENLNIGHPMFDKQIYQDKPYPQKEGVFISQFLFSGSDVSEEIFSHFDDCTIFERISILSLFHRCKRRSFILPLAYIRDWINEKEFINAYMTITGSHFNCQHLFSQEAHFSNYKDNQEFSSLCYQFAKIGTKSQKQIYDKIQQDENEIVEFKQTLSLDINRMINDKTYSPKKEDKIMIEVLITIAGFLNANGGTLYVGVKDRNKKNYDKPIEIPGIKDEIDKLFESSKESYKNYFTEIIKNKFKGLIYSSIYPKIETVFKSEIFIIRCLKSRKKVFLDGKFYLRKGPATHLLNTEQYNDYINGKENYLENN